ncbi:hypothetical protein POSPLADRAFT_1049868 [Postia placenta MAD-698-R-SB12]|uniref:Major facilitator superfamily (MFS) profile domain-containing protein n=1 Tax=Postia placenta MAD-698-R-SB12 TaxID=670580 RepID=A0A1X6MMY9_9APHY|nr:hypothetical protein POSPLADRAFT_1049868 [Postia placenta MAD-698-R-SB12]OSX57639.1 hypothetical protein POSPLADRAFT_1049868 [Postia placenta MAD-698-R-SB12]
MFMHIRNFQLRTLTLISSARGVRQQSVLSDSHTVDVRSRGLLDIVDHSTEAHLPALVSHVNISPWAFPYLLLHRAVIAEDSQYSPALDMTPFSLEPIEQKHAETSDSGPAVEHSSINAADCDFDDVPDGGMWAYMAILGGWLVEFTTFGYSTSFGIFQDYYTVTSSSSSSNISWIGSIQLFLFSAGGLPAGWLFDAGYSRYIFISGSLLFSFCIFMLSLANPHQYYQLLLSQAIGMGIGGGFLLTPACSIQSHYWRKYRAIALGVVQTGKLLSIYCCDCRSSCLLGSSCGSIVFPIMLNRLFYGRAGFAWGVRATAFLTLGLLLIACCLLRPRRSSRAKHRKQGALPPIKPVIMDVPYVLTIVALWLVNWGLYFPYFYQQTWVREHGLSDTLAFYTIAILNAGSVFGRVIPSIAADYMGQLNVIGPIALICSALIFALFGAVRAAPVVVWTVLYGFFSGSCLSLFPSVFAYLANDTGEVG